MRIARFTLLTVWAATALAAWSDAGIHVYGLLWSAWGAVAVLLVWIVALVVQLVRRTPLRQWWAEPLVVLLVIVAIRVSIPFYARFAVSLPSLSRYVARAHTGEKPVRVGLFIVRETEVLQGGVVRLITTHCMFDDCGLAFSRHGTEPPRIGEDNYRRVTARWWRWHRSW